MDGILTCWREFGLLPVVRCRKRANAFFKPSVPSSFDQRLSNKKQTPDPQRKIVRKFSILESRERVKLLVHRHTLKAAL
jgi:hypothetical protein